MRDYSIKLFTRDLNNPDLIAIPSHSQEYSNIFELIVLLFLIKGFYYGVFTSFVPDWTTKDINLGVGYYFSKNWVDTQIIELDGNHENAKIMQGI